MAYFVSALLGYLFGTFNLAYLLAKAKGFDIRDRGSNNPGASNATITMGLKAGIGVGLCDILKAAIPVLLSMFLFSNKDAALLAGASAVMGHMFPFFLKFRGGKGFASFVGMILGFDWRAFLVIGVLILLITFLTDYIVLATFFTIAAFPIYLVIFFPSLMIAAVAVVSCIILYKHRENIKKLRDGTEFKVRSVLNKK